MKRTFLLLSFIAAACALGHAQTAPPSSMEREFGQGGRVRMNLSASESYVRAAAGDRITVRWETKKPKQMKGVKVRVETTDGNATIKTDGPKDGFRVFIEIPARSDLYIRMSAGELHVEGIEGNKDVELRAGELHIDVLDPESYEHVDASVRAGEVDAAPFNISKGGLFRSFKWRGNGRYRLHAHLTAGEVILHSTWSAKPPA
jgi:hypothetical protein